MAYKMNDETARRKRQLEELEARGVDTTYRDKSESLLDAYLNRGAFQYDMNKDPAYNAYRNQYTREGKQAMQDTIATASGLTGGFANSYAVQAGQGAYQAYLNQLNDRIPELYQAAYSRYQQEGNDLYNKYAAANDYYNNLLNDYYNNRNYYASAYENAYNRDYGAYRDSVEDALAASRSSSSGGRTSSGSRYTDVSKAIKGLYGTDLYKAVNQYIDEGYIDEADAELLLTGMGVDFNEFALSDDGNTRGEAQRRADASKKKGNILTEEEFNKAKKSGAGFLGANARTYAEYLKIINDALSK